MKFPEFLILSEKKPVHSKIIAAFLKKINAIQSTRNVFIVSNEGVRNKYVRTVMKPKTNVHGKKIPGYLKKVF